MQDAPGYEFIRELGRGGMAVVYLATQLSLKRPVALKLLDRNVVGYDELASRFMNEAHTLAGLRHPNIVTVYDVVDSPSGDFISMEYLDRGSLSDRLATGLTLQESLSILAQLASALDAAHASGVVHRDIKPDNVLFRDDNTPVLTDFGIARQISADSQRVTQAGLAVGTPNYMSPEQISGAAVDGRADQYSLGSMWFQMLTGKLPFEAEHTSDLLLAHLARPVPDLPPEMAALQPVLERMMAKKADARYPNLAAMLSDLSRCLLRDPGLLRAPPGSPPVNPTERLRQLGFPSTGSQPSLAGRTSQMRSGATVALATGDHLKAASEDLLRPRRMPVAAAIIVLAALAIAAMLWFSRTKAPVAASAPAPTTSAPSAMASSAATAAVDALSSRSIAVLPFADLSKAQDQAYMSDGLAEELLNLLAKVPNLRVIARTSSFSFQGKSDDVATIGRALDVDHVLQGSVRTSGKHLRISAQLIRARDNTQVWSETYDRTVDDVFAVQDEIAAAVVDQLKIKLMGAPPHAQKTDPRAYALYLEARQAGRRGNAEGQRTSESKYRQALAIDPAYAPAWVGLSSSYANQANAGLRPSEEGFRLAREAVDKALAIDPDSARAHAQRGFLAMSHERDLSLAATHLQHALALAPDDFGTLLNAGRLMQSLGRFDQAIAIDQFVATRDPLNARAHYNLGVDLYLAGRPDEAFASWRTTLALSPDFIGTWYNIAIAQVHAGQPEAALDSIRREPAGVWQMIGLPIVYQALGKRADSDVALQALTTAHADDAAYNIAYVHAARGETDRTFEWLDRAVATSDAGLSDIAFEPDFASIHADPRWQPLLEKLGKSKAQLDAVRFEVAMDALRNQ
ncbi:hypothetical protein BH11PSE14_BH11PSE14_12150 [soil metagenome]